MSDWKTAVSQKQKAFEPLTRSEDFRSRTRRTPLCWDAWFINGLSDVGQVIFSYFAVNKEVFPASLARLKPRSGP